MSIARCFLISTFSFKRVLGSFHLCSVSRSQGLLDGQGGSFRSRYSIWHDWTKNLRQPFLEPPESYG